MPIIIGIILCIGFLVCIGFYLDHEEKAERKRRRAKNYKENVKRIEEWLDNWYSAILELTEEYKNYTGDITFEYYAVKSDYFYYHTDDEYVETRSAYVQPHYEPGGYYVAGHWKSDGYIKNIYEHILISPVEDRFYCRFSSFYDFRQWASKMYAKRKKFFEDFCKKNQWALSNTNPKDKPLPLEIGRYKCEHCNKYYFIHNTGADYEVCPACRYMYSNKKFSNGNRNLLNQNQDDISPNQKPNQSETNSCQTANSAEPAQPAAAPKAAPVAPAAKQQTTTPKEQNQVDSPEYVTQLLSEGHLQPIAVGIENGLITTDTLKSRDLFLQALAAVLQSGINYDKMWQTKTMRRDFITMGDIKEALAKYGSKQNNK